MAEEKIVSFDKQTEKNGPITTDNVSTQTMSLCRYLISLVMYNDETDWKEDISKYIIDMTLYNDYDKHYFPICKVKFFLNHATLDKMIEYKKNIKFILSLKVSEAIIGGDTYEDMDVLTPIKLIPLELPDLNVLKSDIKGDNPENMITLELFKYEHINESGKLINRCYNDSTLGAIVTNLLNEYSKKKIIMEIPTNNTKYENIFVPTNNINKAITDLDEKYRLYDSEILVYHDYWYTWILDYNARKVDTPKAYYYETNMIKVEIVPENTTDTQAFGLYNLNDDPDDITYRTTMLPKIQNSKNVNSQIYGNDIKVINIDNNGTTVENHKFTDFTDDTVGSIMNGIERIKQKVIVNVKTSASNIKAAINTMINKKSKQVEVYLQGIDIRNLHPAMKFQIKYNAEMKEIDLSDDETYLLNQTYLSFYKLSNAEDLFEMNATLVLDLKLRN